jgi:hypothetical protein
MIKKFLKLRTTTKLPTVEEWSQQHANKASPDGIIAATIVESLAAHWEDWVATDLEHKQGVYRRDLELVPSLVNNKKKITVSFGVREWTTRTDEYSPKVFHKDWQSEGTKVNGVAIELKAARYIAAGYERLAKQQKALQERAAEAKRNMEANEAKWNLAEQLLGFKRTAEGVLVPAQEVTA